MKRRIFFISLSIITFIFVIISITYILPFKAEGQIQELKGPWSVDTAKVHIDNASIEEVSSILKSLHTRDVVTILNINFLYLLALLPHYTVILIKL